VTARARSRMMILALTGLGHVGLILLLVWGIDVAGRRAPAREPEPLLMVLVDSLVRPEPQPRPVGAPLLSPPSSALLVPEIDSPSEDVLAPPVSDSVPRVDWVGERRREVETVVARQNTPRVRPECDSQVSRPHAGGPQGARDCAPRRDPREARSGEAE
jgi:hypothetical protein